MIDPDHKRLSIRRQCDLISISRASFYRQPAGEIHYAASHPRREFWLTWSTWKVMLGQKVAPGWLDRFLAKAAYSGQLAKEDEEERADNLFESVPGPFGAHGRFGDRAASRSSQLYLSERPGLA